MDESSEFLHLRHCKTKALLSHRRNLVYPTNPAVYIWGTAIAYITPTHGGDWCSPTP